MTVDGLFFFNKLIFLHPFSKNVRDCLLRGYACDYSEKDMVLICGDSTTPASYPQFNLPAEPNGWMFKRMSITNFRCQVQLRGVNKGKVILAALIDPKMALPQSIVDFCLQRIVGYALLLLIPPLCFLLLFSFSHFHPPAFSLSLLPSSSSKAPQSC